MSTRQPDLFVIDAGPELLEERAEKKYHADPNRVREKLYALLAEVKAARSMPWDARTLRLHQTVFPQMTNWLPEEEAAQLCFQFEAELERLKTA